MKIIARIEVLIPESKVKNYANCAREKGFSGTDRAVLRKAYREFGELFTDKAETWICDLLAEIVEKKRRAAKDAEEATQEEMRQILSDTYDQDSHLNGLGMGDAPEY